MITKKVKNSASPPVPYDLRGRHRETIIAIDPIDPIAPVTIIHQAAIFVFIGRETCSILPHATKKPLLNQPKNRV